MEQTDPPAKVASNDQLGLVPEREDWDGVLLTLALDFGFTPTDDFGDDDLLAFAYAARSLPTAETACDAEPGTTLRDAVLSLNHLWNTSNDEATIADQLDLCRRLAKYEPTTVHGTHSDDAIRFRWLTEDHADPDTRAKCRELLGRMGVMSYSSACTDIDSAMARATKRSMLRTADAVIAAREFATCGKCGYRVCHEDCGAEDYEVKP
jgi:hypothetical protein